MDGAIQSEQSVQRIGLLTEQIAAQSATIAALRLELGNKADECDEAQGSTAFFKSRLDKAQTKLRAAVEDKARAEKASLRLDLEDERTENARRRLDLEDERTENARRRESCRADTVAGTVTLAR